MEQDITHSIIADIKKVARRLGKNELSRSEYYQHGKFSHYQIYEGGRNWTSLCKKAKIGTKTKEPISIRLTGGTDVKWSPSWDYFNSVFLDLLKRMGASVNTQLIKRGYYPKGGGEAILTVNPSQDLKPLILENPIKPQIIQGLVHISNLPEHVGKRIKHSVIKSFLKKNLNCNINIENISSLSTGVGITVWISNDNSILGTVGLGERGIPAESVGENTANKFLLEIESGATIDIHGFDQIVPFISLANDSKHSRFYVRNVSSHAGTNMWLIKKFFPDKQIYNISDKFGLKLIDVNGLNFL